MVSWEPTGLGDHVLTALASANSLLILAVVVHLTWAYKWPPYKVKNVTLVCTTGVAGALWNVAIINSYGVYKRTEGTILSSCDLTLLLSWCSLGLLANAAFLRVYRNWKRLLLHDRSMWNTKYQILPMMVPYLVPNIVYWICPDRITFDPDINECVDDFGSVVTPAIGIYSIVLLLIALLLVFRMRHIRHQFNEYDSVRRVVVALVLAPVVFEVLIITTSTDDGAPRRRSAVMLATIIAGILFWTPIREAIWARITKDEEYLHIYAHGFLELPTPAQVREKRSKMTVEELRTDFQRYSQTDLPPEYAHFYNEVLERETVEDYFERQAVTMAIIDQYVRHGAPSEIRLSDACRQQVLKSDVTTIDIFELARLEVLRMMQAKSKGRSRASSFPYFRLFRGNATRNFAAALVLDEDALPDESRRDSLCYSTDENSNRSPGPASALFPESLA